MKMINAIKKYGHSFIYDEDGGAELLEYVIGIVIAAGLIGVVMAIQGAINSGMTQAQQKVTDGFNQALGGAGGTGGAGGGTP